MIAGFLKTRIDYESEIESLEDKLRLKDCEIERLKKELTCFTKEVIDLSRLVSNTPDDCVRGEWCKACEFGKKYLVLDPQCRACFPHEIYICTKGESCKNFIQKEIK